MNRYTLAIFEPNHKETSCVIMYYCCYSETADALEEFSNESTWLSLIHI